MSDDLQNIWQQGSGHGNARGLLEVVRKEQSVRESVWRRNAADLVVSAFFIPITAWAAWDGRGVIIRAGFALITLAQIAAVVAIALYHRRERAAPPADLSVRDYGEQFLAYCDRRIRFLRTSVYWHNVPFLAGLLLFAVGVWRFTGNVVAGGGFVALVVIAAVGIARYGGRLVSEILEKRREVEQYLAGIT